MKPAKKKHSIQSDSSSHIPIKHTTKNQQKFVQKVMGLLPGLVTVYNIKTGKYIYINGSVTELLGYTEKSLMDGGVDFVSSLIHPQDVKTLTQKNQEAINKANNSASEKGANPIVTFEYRLKHKNGNYLWLHTTGVVFDRDTKGKILHVMNISIDITQRKEAELFAERKALEGEDRYKAFLLQSREGIWRIEFKKPITTNDSTKKQIKDFFQYGYVAECNDAMAHMYGYKNRKEIEGMPISSLLLKDDPANTAYVETFITSSYRVSNRESHQKNKTGNDRYFLSNLVGIIQEDQLVRAWGIQQDVTEQKKANDMKQHLAAIVASSDDAIVSKTLEGIITSWNKGAEKIFQWKAKEAIGKHIFLIIPPELRYEEEKIISRIKKGLHIDHYETIRMKKDGTRIHVSLSISPIKNEKGEIFGASKIARDITEKKKFEEALSIGEERLRLAVEAGKIGVWDWDVVNNNIQWSDRVYEIHHISKDKPIGTIDDYSMFIHPLDKPSVMQKIKDALNGSNTFDAEFRILTAEGSTKWITTNAIVLRGKNGKPLRILGAAIDITERKTMEQQKDEFMGIVSHELKTPVTSLKAYIQVLQLKFAREQDEKTVVHLSKIDSQINKLTGLISDLLDITKIEGGKLSFHNEYFYFDELVAEVVEEIQRTTNKHLLIRKGSTKKTIYGDRDRLGQVIINFLTNAIKYSPNAKEVIMRSESVEDSIKFSVQDFGVGISEEKRAHIFERFYREVDDHDLTFPGLGLGLYISAQIINRLHGKISVESKKGKGSIFTFTIPIHRIEEASEFSQETKQYV